MNVNKLFRHLPIRTKLAIGFALIALLPLTVMGTYGLWITSGALESSAVAQVRHHVDLIKSDLGNLLGRTQSDLNYLEQLDWFSDLVASDVPQLPPAPLVRTIAEFCNSHPGYFQIRYLDADGVELLRIVDRDGDYVSLPPDDVPRGARFYHHLIEQNRPDPFLSVPVELRHPFEPGKLVPAVSFVRVSLDASQRSRGMWVADLYAERLIDILQRPTVLPGGELVLCDGEGHYLYHPARKKEWQQLLASRSVDNVYEEWGPELAEDILSRDEGVIVAPGGDIVAHTTVWIDPSDPTRGYVVYYRVPPALAFAPARQFGRVFLLLGLLTLLLVAGAAYLGAGQLTRPLVALSQGAKVIAGGDFAHRISVASNDEIETLAGDFNRMAAAMAERDGLIVAHEAKLSEYALNLEGMVEARTAQLRDSQRLLARSEKLAAVGRLAAGLAHEINNPIGIILNRIETMHAQHQSAKDENLRKDLLVLADHARRIGSITQSLLQFSRPRELHRVQMDLGQACKAVIDLIKPEYVRRHVNLDVTWPPTPLKIEGDQDRVQQVVLNLLDNALDASSSGQTVCLELQHKEGLAVIHVQDVGCGIATEDLDRIFDPFFTTKPAGEGSGLGLTITHELVRDHGGMLHVASVLGQGTTFLVELPLGLDRRVS